MEMLLPFGNATECNEWNGHVAAAVEAVELAAVLTRRAQAGAQTPQAEKPDCSPVTVADLGAQCIVSAVLARAFPGIPLIAEEDARVMREQSALNDAVSSLVAAAFAGAHLPLPGPSEILAFIDRGAAPLQEAPEYTWVLDPIDGTKGFLRGGQYAIALALLHRGSVQIGVLACPSLPPPGSADAAAATSPGALMVAVRGAGTFERVLGQPSSPWKITHVSETTNSGCARLVESVEAAHSSHSRSASILARLTKSPSENPAPVRMDSQAKYACVARGDADVYLRLPKAGYSECIWDHAAGALIVQEAGGCVTDIAGQPLDFSAGRHLAAANDGGIIVTNGRLHRSVLDAL